MQTINLDRLRLEDGDYLLDVGCGEGRHAIGAWLHARIHVTGVDLSDKDLATARERQKESEIFLDGTDNRSLVFEKADARSLPYKDDHFDKVICSEVLEHIDDYRGVLREIKRVLKPDGLLAISVPRAWPEEICWRLSKGYHSVPGGHIRIFNATHLRRDIEAFGWQRYHRHWAHALHVPYWWLKCWKWEQPSRLVDRYHQLLVWDLMERPKVTRYTERLLNPILGKSIAMYFEPAKNSDMTPDLSPGKESVDV